MRLIDADALMKEFADFVAPSNKSNSADVPTWNDAVSLLGSAPTIEPKKGKWIPVTKIYKVTEEQFPKTHIEWVDATEPDEIDGVRCSECGTVYDFIEARNWCSECGADMRG